MELIKKTSNRGGRVLHEYWLLDDWQYKVSWYSKHHTGVQIRTKNKRPKWVDFFTVYTYNIDAVIIRKVDFTFETFRNLQTLFDYIVKRQKEKEADENGSV